jgi:hypothetical protein
MQKELDADPPLVDGHAASNGYDESLATIKGRFLVRSTKEKILIEIQTTYLDIQIGK